jgi:hypothetical protein
MGRRHQIVSVHAEADPATTDRSLRDDLLHLIMLELIDSCEQGQGVRRVLVTERMQVRGLNRPE